tara:strand:+ start:1324 stop:1572 length:249 start_codon:yes stop_codon:yes gene_type:complete
VAEKDVLEKLNEMHTDIVLIRSDLKVTQEDVQDHHKTLYGNGRDGLAIRVDRIETSQSTAHKMWVAMVGVASTVIAWLGLGK